MCGQESECVCVCVCVYVRARVCDVPIWEEPLIKIRRCGSHERDQTSLGYPRKQV